MMRRVTRLLALAVLVGAAHVSTALAALPPGASLTGVVCTQNAAQSFTLKTSTGHIETPDGNAVLMWSYVPDTGSFQSPGPTLCVTAGQPVTIRLRNTGLTEPTSIVFPGQDSPVTATGGEDALLGKQALPGQEVTYTFTPQNAGTYLYESGTDPSKQVEMGLFGTIIVRPAGFPTRAYADPSTAFDPTREYLLVFHEIDPWLHRDVETGVPYDFGKLHFRYFTINGRAFPDTIQDNYAPGLPTQPYGSLIRVKAYPYDPAAHPLPALVRMVNAGLINHPFHPHAYHVKLIARDGRMVRPTEHFGDVVASGSTQDTLFTFLDKDSFCVGPQCTTPQKKIPDPWVLPDYRNLTFKGADTWYSGSPYLGATGALPAGIVTHTVCGEWYFPWHSHALNEFVNYDEAFGGMATLLRVDPLAGCTAFANSTKINTGTTKAGSYTALTADDTTYYQVNATAGKTDWYAGFTNIPSGALSLKVSYTGFNSVACNQTLTIWKWGPASAPLSGSWVALPGGAGSVGPAGAAYANLAAAAPLTQYVGTGSYRGQVRVGVTCSVTPAAAFFSSGNFLKLTYDAP